MELIMYVDGGCKNNQDPEKRKAYGSFKVFFKPDKKSLMLEIMHETCNFGNVTNNQAEYMAVLTALGKTSTIGIKTITIYMDSALVFNQVWGNWKTIVPALVKLRDELLDILHSFDQIDGTKVKAEWVPRDEIVARLGH